MKDIVYSIIGICKQDEKELQRLTKGRTLELQISDDYWCYNPYERAIKYSESVQIQIEANYYDLYFKALRTMLKQTIQTLINQNKYIGLTFTTYSSGLLFQTLSSEEKNKITYLDFDNQDQFYIQKF